jgi:hypothetical protein
VHRAVLVVIGAVCALLQACGKSPSQSFAECESGAYAVIGLQPSQSASVDYTEKKAELVRVCMVKAGYKFKATFTDGEWADVLSNEYKARGLYSTPSYQIPSTIHAEIMHSVRKQHAEMMMNSNNWH